MVTVQGSLAHTRIRIVILASWELTNYHTGSKPRLNEPIRGFGHLPKRWGLCLQNIYNGSFTLILRQIIPQLLIFYFYHLLKEWVLEILLLLTAAKFFHFFLNLPPCGIEGHSLVLKPGTWSRFLNSHPPTGPPFGVTLSAFVSYWRLASWGRPHVGDTHFCPPLRPSPGSVVVAALTSRVTTTESVLSLVRTLSGLTQHRSVSQVRSLKRVHGADFGGDWRGEPAPCLFPHGEVTTLLRRWLSHSDPCFCCQNSFSLTLTPLPLMWTLVIILGPSYNPG